MNFKLDENFGTRTAPVFHDLGHEVQTVYDEKLGGAPDEMIFQACVKEQRCLVTLDLDFADVLRFPPHQCGGIAVLRLPKHASRDLLSRMVLRLLVALQADSIAGRLWIVETTRIRVHDQTDEADD